MKRAATCAARRMFLGCTVVAVGGGRDGGRYGSKLHSLDASKGRFRLSLIVFFHFLPSAPSVSDVTANGVI